MSLTTGLVTMVTVAMVTFLWLHVYLCTLVTLRVILALFTPCISMVTQWLMLLGNVSHVLFNRDGPHGHNGILVSNVR